ncbi:MULTISPECIES: DUF6158 family protein [Streptomyces]|uniref:DUF6158 family protein n=1 Tax=Streptomyces pratisoli TaxID=3139917 RepID=A0ACC6QFY8_9ACTN|nr:MULTISPECIES: DUF6158 family protein [unclassified Streptomyces]MCX4509181.1 DUF6158 family protein [Streptomyces sp. NBC_01619]
MAERDRGVAPEQLDEGLLLKELEAIHRTRHETLLYGSDDALETHTARMAALEAEYVRRHPQRATSASRTRAGARARGADGC